MRNEPNFKKSQMVVTAVYTMTNNNEQRTTNYSKRTQSNPIYPERSRRIYGELACGELVEGVESVSPPKTHIPTLKNLKKSRNLS